MAVDEFTERLARIRERFAASLPRKINDAFNARTVMSASSANAIETVVVVHRTLHEMCGIAPTVGFPATGKAARAVETVLREPAKTKRPLRTDEVAMFVAEIGELRSAAQSELQSNIGQG